MKVNRQFRAGVRFHAEELLTPDRGVYRLTGVATGPLYLRAEQLDAISEPLPDPRRERVREALKHAKFVGIHGTPVNAVLLAPADAAPLDAATDAVLAALDAEEKP